MGEDLQMRGRGVLNGAHSRGDLTRGNAFGAGSDKQTKNVEACLLAERGKGGKRRLLVHTSILLDESTYRQVA